MDSIYNRRSFLKTSAAISVLGLSLEEQALLAAQEQPVPQSSEPESMPYAVIQGVRISRLICGGNLLNGFAHSRDLLYVSDLLKHYFTDEKIIDTWRLCERQGINSMISTCDSPYAGGGDPTVPVLNRYRKEFGGRIQWLAQCEPSETDLTSRAAKAIDNGAAAVILQGERGDRWVKENRLDRIEKFVEFGKKHKVLVGVASHSIQVPIAVEAAGLGVDFYMKTLHHENYWSNMPKEPRVEVIANASDNYFSLDPQTTVDVMKDIHKPWIAFKVLAAGAISPESGFDYAFGNGADFACVGMFDFQVQDDARIARETIEKYRQRPRPWHG